MLFGCSNASAAKLPPCQVDAIQLANDDERSEDLAGWGRTCQGDVKGQVLWLSGSRLLLLNTEASNSDGRRGHVNPTNTRRPFQSGRRLFSSSGDE